MPKVIGDVAVVINPDATGFRQLADFALRKQLAGFRPEIRLGVNDKEVAASLTSLKARIKALGGQLTDLRIGADTKGAEAKVVALQAKLTALTKQLANITMGADTKKLDAALAAEEAKLKLLQQQASKLSLDADSKKAVAKLLDLQKQAAHLQEQLGSGKLKTQIDIKAAEAKIKALDAEILVLKNNAQTVRVAAETKAINAAIEAVKANIAALKREAADIKLGADPAKLLAAEAALLGLENIAQNLGKKDMPVAATAMSAFSASMRRSTTAAAAGWKLLTGHIVLFGGALNQVLPKMFTSVAVWHLLADAIIETVAVWTPAIIAVTAFGVAGSDAAKEVYNRMKAVHTVMDATGKAVPPLSNNFRNLASSVRPEVYQLFGDALVIMNKRGGAFNTVATGTGRVLDQLAARFVYAVTTGTGVNKFMEHAVDDVAKLGDSIGNLGGIFGAVFRAVPGYAEILLTVGDSITKVLETVTQAAEPVIAFGLALHGAVIYGGVAITAMLGLVAGLVKVTAAFRKFNESVNLVGLNAVKNFGSGLVTAGKKAIEYSGFILEMGRDSGIAAAATTVLGDGMRALGKIPVTVWAVAAAAALISLVYAITQSRDSAQRFNEALQQTIQNAPLANVVTTIQQAQAVTAAHLADSTRKLNEAIKTNTSVNAGRAGTLNSNGTAIQNLDNASRHYAEGLGQLTDQQKLVTSRFSALSREYGGNVQALGALNAAGITTAQITDTNKDHWAQALIQVDATTRAYKAMGTQAGTLGNDLDVLGRTVTDQYQATQKLNQAWSQFITDVTGTQGSFDTVIQGFQTLNGHSGALKLTLGKLKATFADTATSIKNVGAVATATASVASAQNALNKLQSSGKGTALQLAAAHSRLTGAQDRLTVAQNNLAAAQKQGTSAIDALTPAGIALNQAFTDQVQNIDKLFASWRTAGLANNLFTQGVKAAIIPMVKYAGGSKEATAQLVALAEEAGYQGPISLQALTKWLGNTHGATQKLKDITNQATEQEALLTGAMQAQGSYIANTLLRDINNAILKYNGVEDAARAYGNAVAKSGAQSDAAHNARQRLITDIIKSGTAAGDSKQQIAAMISKVLGIPPKKALQIVMNGLGEFSIKQVFARANPKNQSLPGGFPGGVGAATGLYINRGTGPTADDVMIRASRGELIVPAHLVRAGAVDHLRGAIPGFAAGGVAGGPVGRYARGGLLPHIGNLTEGGNTSVLTGQYAYDRLGAFGGAMQAAMVPAMRAALKSAESAAAMAGGYAGPGSGNYAADIQAVLRLFGLPLSLTANWLRQIQSESGGRLNAVNLTDSNAAAGHPSVGILQLIPGTFHAYAGPYVNTPPLVNYGGGTVSLNPMAQIYAAINYARHTYPNMAAVIGHGHGYAAGGLVRAFAEGGLIGGEYATGGLTGIGTHQVTGLASGGKIPVGKYLPQLKSAQGHEYHDYTGLRKAYLTDLAHARPGSWTSGHRASIRSVLGTFARRQSAEEAAYDNILHHGTAKANLSKFATRVRDVRRSAQTKTLSHSHPGWTHGIQHWLGVLAHLAQADVAPAFGGSQAKLQFGPWLARLKAAEKDQEHDLFWLYAAFYHGLRHAGKGSWLHKNRTAVRERLYALAVRDKAEDAAYRDLVSHATGSAANLDAMAGRIGKVGRTAQAELNAVQPALLGHRPGGYPAQVKQVQDSLRLLIRLTSVPPFNPPWAPGNLGPSHTVAPGVLQFARGGMVPVRRFDRGGLWPSGTFGWNGSGRTETVTPGGAGPSEIHLHVHNNGVIGSQQQTDTWLQNSLNRLARTGYLSQSVRQAGGR